MKVIGTKIQPRQDAEYAIPSYVIDVEDDFSASYGTAMSDWVNSRLKRGLDVALAASGLAVSLPLLAIVAAAVRVSSRGPVLFRQSRVGRNQVPFTIYKFRTMRHACEGPLVTCKGDDRMTRVGHWLRRMKLDELPQLANVLRGDMSFVGPRPKVPGHEKHHLTMRPGITGAATLLFAREEELLTQVPVEHVETYTVDVLNPLKARIDRQYAEHASFASDVRLLAHTVLRLSRRRVITNLHDVPNAAKTSILWALPRAAVRVTPKTAYRGRVVTFQAREDLAEIASAALNGHSAEACPAFD